MPVPNAGGDARIPSPKQRVAVLTLFLQLLLVSCGGGGSGGNVESRPPASTQTVTVAIGEHDATLALSARLVLPEGAPDSQPAPDCALIGPCRGLIAASAVESRTLIVNIASALPLGPGPAECFTCSNLTVPEGTLAADYRCSCLEGVSDGDLQLSSASCPAGCSVALPQ